MKPLVIAIDFDGTIVKSKWPGIGKFRWLAKPVLKWLKRRENILILNTCRECSHEMYIPKEKCPLCAVIKHLGLNGIHFDYCNENAKHPIDQYGDCRKIGADLYLDDMAFFPGWLWIPLVVLWMELKMKRNS